MIRREFPVDSQLYRVQLGHLAIMVEARDPQEAIQRARRKMCEEWPRLWDKIDQAESDKFRVEPV